MKKRLTDQEKIDIVSCYKSGMTIIEIGNLYDRGKGAIYSLLKRRNKTKRKGDRNK